MMNRASILLIGISLLLAACGARTSNKGQVVDTSAALNVQVGMANSTIEQSDTLSASAKVLIAGMKQGKFKVVSYFRHCDSTDPDFKNLASWQLDGKDIRHIFIHSEVINGPEWHHLYDVFRCWYSGEVMVNDVLCSFTVAAGSYTSIRMPDTSILLGYFGKNKKLFYSYAWEEE